MGLFQYYFPTPSHISHDLLLKPNPTSLLRLHILPPPPLLPLLLLAIESSLPPRRRHHPLLRSLHAASPPSFLSFHLRTLSSSSPSNPLRLLAGVTTLSSSSLLPLLLDRRRLQLLSGATDSSLPPLVPPLRLRLHSGATGSSPPSPSPPLRLRLLPDFFLTEGGQDYRANKFITLRYSR